MGYEKNKKQKRKSRYLYDLATKRPKGDPNVKVKNVTPRTHENDCVFNRVTLRKKKSQNPLRATDTIGQEKGPFLKFRVFAARENAQNENISCLGREGVAPGRSSHLT